MVAGRAGFRTDDISDPDGKQKYLKAVGKPSPRWRFVLVNEPRWVAIVFIALLAGFVSARTTTVAARVAISGGTLLVSALIGWCW
jgi:hypothetical protein